MEADRELSSPVTDDVAVFRQFNRMYRRFSDSLEEGVLGTRYNLAESRVIYELATRTAPKTKDLTAALGLNSGHLSRLIADLERAGLLRRQAGEPDGQGSELSLTAEGRAEFETLNARSEEQARTVLENLPLSGRTQLIRSMQAIEKAFTGTVEGSGPLNFTPASYRRYGMGGEQRGCGRRRGVWLE